METTQNTTFAAFESFLKQDYKSCITVLNKLKSARTQNEKLSTRIHHNLAIAEFMNGKMSNVNNLLSKLDEVLSEIKTKGPVKRKDSAKGAGASEDDASETSGAEANDETLVKYNYAIALNLAGKRNKSIDLLREIFQSKETVCDYLSLKNALVYLDLAIATKDYAAVKSALEFLENIKKQVGSSNNDISYDNEEEKETIKDPKKEDPKKTEKETRHYNSLIFGGEIYKHGEIPLRVCRTEFDFILNIYHIFLLMSLKEEDLAKKKLKTCKSIYNELTRLAKDGKNEKLEANVSYAASIAPYIEKHASILFSFTKAYMAYQTQSYTKCIKLMNTVEIMGISEEESYTAYQLNNIACCHLRMQKYALAAFYFSKALNILQKQNKGTREDNSAFKKYDAILNLNAIQQYPFIMHNYALALLQLEKFDEATDMYTKLAEYWPDNPRVWYRLALCHLGKYQKTIEATQNQRRNNLYQSLLDSPSVSLLGEEDTKKQSPEELSNKKKAVYTRYVLSARDNTFRGSEEESKMSNGPKYTNQDAPQASAKQLKCLLDKAAKCFRNASVIARKKKLKYQKDQTLQVTLKPHDNHRMSEDTEETKATENSEVDDDKHNSMVVKLARNIKEYQDILQSSLTYLAFTSLCIGEINNAINYAKGCLDLNYVSDENKYMCFIYLVEAYCLLGKQKEALSQINAMNLNQVIMTCAQNVLGVNQPYLLRTLSSKVAIYTNLASVHLLSNNLTAAQAALDNALKSIEPAQPQTPIPLLNLMVYLNLKLDKPETALQILKRRSVPAEGNKPVLHIVRPVN